jgi:putative addiction module killer protein
MRWIAPTEKDTANETLENRLWAAADQFRANSGLKAAQYSVPVLGLIVYFMRRGATVVLLLGGGDKRTQESDIELAIRIAKDWRG